MTDKHPWRYLRDQYPHWVVVWATLPGDLLGYTHHAVQLIVLNDHLLQAERRCTLAHELEHIARGPLPNDPVLAAREELDIERTIARQLIPERKLVDIAHWTTNRIEAADELWVDVPTLEARLRSLEPDERARIEADLENIHLP